MATDWVEQIKHQMQQKSTEELLDIWVKNDHLQWSDSAFKAVRLILEERHIPIPKQGEPVTAPPPTAYWEIRLTDGLVRRYADGDEIINAIMAGEIRPKDQSRRILTTDQSPKQQEPKWEEVSRSLVRSSFRIRVLFQPVWAHTLHGGLVGTMIGVIFWLASGVIFFLGKVDNPVAGIIYGIFLTGWMCGALEMLWPINLGIFTKGALVLGILVLVCLGFDMGAGPTFLGLSLGLTGVFVSTLSGILAGGLPGMTLGTIIGLMRKGRLRVSPTAPPEDLKPVLVKGLILPSVVWVCLAVLYIVFMPRLIEIATAS